MARDLTTLEYIVLGMISLQPQSGYDIVSSFDDDAYSWSASPGSIYPMLKRLEKQDLIIGDLEIEYETRPRKVYTLTDAGATILDDWLRVAPKMRPYYEQREINLLRFQFMEKRLTKEEVLGWLSNYLDSVNYAGTGTEFYQSEIRKAMEEHGAVSPHTQLLMEAYVMELNALRTWIEMAIQRIQFAN